VRAQLKAPAESVRTKTGAWLQQPRVRLGAVVAVAAAAGIIAWAVIGGGGESSNPTTPAARAAVSVLGPIGLSPEGLAAQSRSLGQPIYWAGAKGGYTYELTRTAAGRVYVRYLPPGTPVGAKGGDFLVIATYPFPKAMRALKALARNGGGLTLRGGAFAYTGPRPGTSVYVAYPRVPYEIEVYAPSPARARSVAVSGDVRPVR
jgi:hypothetical protein